MVNSYFENPDVGGNAKNRDGSGLTYFTNRFPGDKCDLSAKQAY